MINHPSPYNHTFSPIQPLLLLINFKPSNPTTLLHQFKETTNLVIDEPITLLQSQHNDCLSPNDFSLHWWTANLDTTINFTQSSSVPFLIKSSLMMSSPHCSCLSIVLSSLQLSIFTPIFPKTPQHIEIYHGYLPVNLCDSRYLWFTGAKKYKVTN